MTVLESKTLGDRSVQEQMVLRCAYEATSSVLQ